MNNSIIAIDQSGSFRVYLTLSTDAVAEACRIHETSPLATQALGRVLTGAGLMGLMLKEPKDRITLQFKGDGPAREILATAYGSGDVKGYISNRLLDLPPKEDGSPDVGGALGIGVLTVIKDVGLKEPYVGRIDLSSGEIADDLTMYFFLSEQQSSSVALGVSSAPDCPVKAAAGFIVQMLPDAVDGAAEALENALAGLGSLSRLAEDCDGPRELLDKVFGTLPAEFSVSALEERNIRWHCGCSMERLEQVMLTLGADELRRLLEEDGEAELTCQFCRSRYHFDRAHLEMLLRVSTQAAQIKEERRKRYEAQQKGEAPEPRKSN
jgi:molecular chaperone Hsp33